jgi:hypothetical protein
VPPAAQQPAPGGLPRVQVRGGTYSPLPAAPRALILCCSLPPPPQVQHQPPCLSLCAPPCQLPPPPGLRTLRPLAGEQRDAWSREHWWCTGEGGRNVCVGGTGLQGLTGQGARVHCRRSAGHCTGVPTKPAAWQAAAVHCEWGLARPVPLQDEPLEEVDLHVAAASDPWLAEAMKPRSMQDPRVRPMGTSSATSFILLLVYWKSHCPPMPLVHCGTCQAAA